MSLATPTTDRAFEWRPQPGAAALVNRLLSEYVAQHARLADLSEQLRLQTGTRLTDWVDHLVVPTSESLAREAADVGYHRDSAAAVWRHSAGMFPPLVPAKRPMHGDLTAG